MAHNYDGANWVAYDRQYRRYMLARKDLNWSTPNSRLYNEAFTRRAKVVPRCPHCLGDDHGGATCPHNPAPLVWSWLPDLRQLHVPVQQQLLGGHTQLAVCRNYNDNRCRFSRCQFMHVCQDCLGSHPAVFCPRQESAPATGAMVRNRNGAQGKAFPGHQPYPMGQRR